MPKSIPTSPSQLIKEAEARLRLVLDCVGDGSWDWNIETGEVFYSDRWIELLRYNRSEVPPYISFWKSLVHPADEERFRDALSKHLERRADSLEVEYNNTRKPICGIARSSRRRGARFWSSTGISGFSSGIQRPRKFSVGSALRSGEETMSRSFFPSPSALR